MVVEHTIMPVQCFYPADKKFNLDKTLFFDIETTGFSPGHSHLYLIGCIYFKDGVYHFIQWFSDLGTLDDEKQLLENFLTFSKPYDLFVTYNGETFDLPYIEKKASFFGLSYEKLSSFDIYKQIRSYKPLFQVSNLKLKTMEQFLGINREDKYDGQKLIAVYKDYLKTKDPLSYNRMLLHNREDVTSLISLLALLSYDDFFQGCFGIMSFSLSEETLTVVLIPGRYIHIPLLISCSHYELTLEAERAVLKIPVNHGKIKYFYRDFKNYFYLPEEDMSVHKSLAAFVDHRHKERAQPHNCYTYCEAKALIQSAENEQMDYLSSLLSCGLSSILSKSK